MSFTIRVFGYRGTRQIPRANANQFTGDSVDVLDEPYIWSQPLLVNGSTPPAFTTQGPGDKATTLRIEVPDGQAIRFEINPPSRAIVAGNQSPRQTGDQNYAWGDQWSLSVVDAASFP